MSFPIIPGGEGYGMLTRAAYGGGVNPAIIRVTNVNDSGPGSLRAAIDAAYPRVVIFETSGIIDGSDLGIVNPYITIAGQTAPSPGITLKGGGIQCFTHDILVQHIRIRPGDGGAVLPQTADHDANENYSLYGAGTVYNIVFDHVSFSWAGGKNTLVLTYGNANITYWRCIISEALYYASNVIVSPSQPSSLGLIMSMSPYVSILGSLFAHNSDRNPEIHEGSVVQFINNVVYDWGKDTGNNYQWASFIYAGTGVDTPVLVDIIGNVYIAGGGTHPFTPLYAVGVWDAKAGSQLYTADNLLDTTMAGITDYFNHMFPTDIRVGSPTQGGVSILPSSATKAFVLANAGARPLDRDSVDTRIVNDVLNYTGTVISSQNQVGGWPASVVTTRSLAPPIDPHTTTPSGYTNLEVWLQEFADAVAPAGGTTIPTAAYYASPTGNDGAAGTIGAPFRTITHAASVLTAGDTLLLRAGTYDEALVTPGIAGTSWSNKIRIAAYPGETVTLKPPASAVSWVLNLHGGEQYLEFDGINLDTTNANASFRIGGMSVNADANSHHIRFINATILTDATPGDFTNSRFGVELSGDALAIGFNEIGPGVTIRSISPPPASYFGLAISTSDNHINGVDAHDMGLVGLQIYNGGANKPQRNVVENSRFHDINTSFDTERAGIIVVGDDTIIRNNFVYNINANGTGSGVSAISILAGTGNQVLNNTVTNNHGNAFSVGSASNTSFINNLAYGNDFDGIIDSGTGTTKQTNMFGTNPLFVDSANGDFHLQSGSAAKDAGTNLASVSSDSFGGARPFGTTTDVGAHEFGSTPTVPISGGGSTVGGITTTPLPPPPLPALPTATTISGTPTNTSFLTAYDVGTLPFNIIETTIRDGVGTKYTTYFKIHAVTDGVVGVRARKGDGGAPNTITYNVEIWEGSAAAPTQVYPDVTIVAFSAPIQWSVHAGHDYFLKVVPVNPFTGSPPSLSLDGQFLAQSFSYPTGSIIVPDDTGGFPAAVISNVNGQMLGFLLDFAASESGDSISSGKILMLDDDSVPDERLQIYSNALVSVKTILTATIGISNVDAIRGAISGDRWYIATTASANTKCLILDQSGSVIKTLNINAAIDGGRVAGIAASPDNTILYYAGSANSIIRRWDITNDVALSNFAPSLSGYEVGGILQRDGIVVLSDGAVVVMYSRSVAGSVPDTVRIYNPDGTTRIDITTFARRTVDRIAGAANPAHFMVWTQPTITDHFVEIDANGNIVNDVTNDEFENAVWQGNIVTTPDPPFFGHSESCPFFVIKSTPLGGLTPRIEVSLACCAAPNPTSGGGVSGGTNNSNAGPVPNPPPPPPPLVGPAFIQSCVGGGTVPDVADLDPLEYWDY